MAKILLASQNPGKIREICDYFNGLAGDSHQKYPFLEDLVLVKPSDLAIRKEVSETGMTYAENAALKARAYWQLSSMVTLGDDSGLEVAALDGAPGLHSRRYSPLPGASDADRRVFLLEQLHDKSLPWTAHFHCTVAIADMQGTLRFAEGNCHGEIIADERGSNGFGYDPIFLLPELGRTMAELSLEEKNRLSHRARALNASLPLLQKIFDQEE